MNIQGWAEIALTLGLAALIGWPVGIYLSRVWNGERTWLDPVLKPVEGLFYRASGVNPTHSQGWVGYAGALLAFNAVGFLFSARDREAEKIEALDLGANDYVEKPFGVGELLARIRASLRQGADPGARKGPLVVGDVVIDLDLRRVTRLGEAVRLTPKDYDLRSHLARHADKLIGHAELLTAVWGAAHASDTQYLRVVIGQIRRKLEADPAQPRLILTEPGVGYRLQK